MTIRFVFSLMTFLVFIAIAGFVLTNMETRVTLTFWETPLDEVRLVYVVILAAVVGVVYTGVIAVVEGAAIRLENTRLRKEVERLETELTYARTQHLPARPEPDALSPGVGRELASGPGRTTGQEAPPASAPVYSSEGDEWSHGRDDETSSGGSGG